MSRADYEKLRILSISTTTKTGHKHSKICLSLNSLIDIISFLYTVNFKITPVLTLMEY